MIDLHSHILPQMDDGSRSVEESLRMLTALAAQGVTDVAATPHFYASENSPERFLARRGRAWQQLAPHLTEQLPQVHLGAEVLFFEGISVYEPLPQLCLTGTDTLLLEMPFRPWSRRMYSELLELAERRDITLVLAHMERYLPYVEEADWQAMEHTGMLLQANADLFCRFSTRRKALRLLRDGRIRLLGTDCHNMTDRAPHMDEAVRRIARGLGEDAVRCLREQAEALLPAREVVL